MSPLPWRRDVTRPSAHDGDIEATHPFAMPGERMASNVAGVSFSVRIDGAWRWTRTKPSDHHNPAAVARDQLRRKAAHILREHSVLDLPAACDAVNTAIGRWTSPEPGLEVNGTVHLNVPARDRCLAQEHSYRRQAADRAHEEELHRLFHLQRILSDHDLRRVWWMAQFPDRFTECDGLAHALHDLPSPDEVKEDSIRDDIHRFTDKLLTDLHTPQLREVFLTALVQTLRALGHHELGTAAAHFQSRPAPGSATE